MSDDLPESDRTIIRPASTPATPPPDAERTAFAAPAPPGGTLLAPAAPAAAPRTGGGIQVGDVLNHIFEVRRFIARGGMGEVFEGVNVNSDERVAIKVILPSLAADPNVQAMFRKEARTLTRLSHPALVQYRVLAQEPTLGVFYIVTEYIDGANLADMLGELKPDAAALRQLTRRLAEGLSAAHALGAIHRDMSPDNVLLEDRRLDKARVIDFGIAKDLDPGAKTVIGDGFAGKLGYVAPEQLGDFDREIGPWTDVYSLALVVLAVASGKNVALGGSFVDAIDKRRKGIDTSAAPPELRPVLDRMLAANPADRLRSMEAVVAALAEPVPVAAAVPAAVRTVPPLPVAAAADGSGGKRGLLIGGAAAALLVLGGGAWLAFGGEASPPPAPEVAAAGPTLDGTRMAVARALPGVPCTWLDLTGVSGAPDGLTLTLAGVAGAPAQAQAAISTAAGAAGARLAATDFSDVAPIAAAECGAIDAFRAIRADGPPRLSVAQRSFEMSPLPADSNYAGQLGARAIVRLDLADPALDFAVYGIEPSGAISGLIADRRTFAATPKTGPIADLGGDRYRLQIDANHAGWSGILLLTGRGGFADRLVVGETGAHDAAWRDRFAAAAAANGWKAEMVWFKMVDDAPGG